MRLRKTQKEALARDIFQRGVNIARESGEQRRHGSTTSIVAGVRNEADTLRCSLRHTPRQEDAASCFPSDAELLDIYDGSGAKVFSVWLTGTGATRIVTFRYGPWMNLFVSDSFQD